MQVTVSRVSPVVVSLRIELPKERVSGEIEKAYSALARTAEVKGFRKGKAPRALLRQYYGAKVDNDVVATLIDATLDNAIRDSKVDSIGAQPRIEIDALPNGSADWGYTAKVEVRPEIANIDYSVLSLTKKVYEIDDHDIGHVLDEKREEHATLRTPEPMRPAVKTDSVTFDWDLISEGAVLAEYSARGRTSEIGRGVLFAEVEEGLQGMSPGETRDISVSFPETHPRKEIAGKTATLRVTVTALQEKILPALDDEFAKDVGSDSLEALRASIRADLEKQYAEKSDDEIKDQAINLLVKAHPIEVPPYLLTQILAPLRQSMLRGLAAKGTDTSALDEILRPEAELRARAGLLLTEIARQNGLLVTEADLSAAMEQIAKERNLAVQRVRAEYQNETRRQDLIGRVLEDKVTTFILDKSTITETRVPTHSHDEAGAASAETPAPSAP